MYDDESSLQSWASYSEASFDSDKIDSDIEAELYGAIHHETVKTPSQLDHSTGISVGDEPETSDLCNGYETPEVKVIKDFSFSNSNVLDDLDSKSNVDAALETEDVNGESVNEEPDVVNEDIEVIKTPKIKVITTPKNNLKRKFESLIQNLNTTSNTISFNNLKSTENKDTVKEISTKKQKNSRNINRKSNSPVVIDSSSDSDSIIWSEDDEVQLVEVQTNIRDREPLDVVSLSSDSSSDDSLDPLDEACLFKGSLGNYQGSDSPPSTSEDPWHINSEDLYRSYKRGSGSRYHENAVLNCTNCKLKGHTVKFCTAPKTLKCYTCGDDHRGSFCQSKVCKKCYRVGHDSRVCGQRFVEFCQLCNMRGHPVKYCPDLWRRYHVTTTSGRINVANTLPQDSSIYCFNCGQEGHTGAVCRMPYPDKFCFPTLPHVISYEHPRETIKKNAKEQRDIALGGTPNWSQIAHYQQNNFAQCQNSGRLKNKKRKLKMLVDSDGRKIKKKKNKKKKNLNTSNNSGGTTKSKDFSFPRTPKSDKKNIGKRKRNQEFS